jgi:hypothetical protein
VIGTESTAHVARAYAAPERQIRVVKGGEQLNFDGFSVQVIRSVHGISASRIPAKLKLRRPLCLPA